VCADIMTTTRAADYSPGEGRPFKLFAGTEAPGTLRPRLFVISLANTGN
jgi:hypothetical protein